MSFTQTSNFGFGSNGDMSGGTVNAANDGLSLSGTAAVLGQDVSEAGNPAILASNREIPMNSFFISLNDVEDNSADTVMFGGSDIMTIYNIFGSGINIIGQHTATGADIRRSDNSANFTITVTNTIASFGMSSMSGASAFAYQDGSLTITSDPANFAPAIAWVDSSNAQNAILELNNTEVGDGVLRATYPVQFLLTTTEPDAAIATLLVNGTVQTAQVAASGNARWALGNAVTGTFDPSTNFAPISINGSTYYLLLYEPA